MTAEELVAEIRAAAVRHPARVLRVDLTRMTVTVCRRDGDDMTDHLVERDIAWAEGLT